MIVRAKFLQNLLAFVFAFTLLLINSASSIANEPDIFEKQKRDHVAISAAMETCSQDTAISVSFDDVFDPRPGKFQANPKYLHKCVKLDAIASWRRIIRDKYYSYNIDKNGIFRADESMKLHIGLAGHEAMRSAKLMENSISGKITGVLATCGFTMSGYCHYEDGPYIVMKSVNGQKITSRTRYLGRRAQKELGNLTELDEAKAMELGIYSFFDKWIDAITARDQKSFEWIVDIAGYGDGEHTRYEDHQKATSGMGIHGYYRGLWEAFFDPDTPYMQIDKWNGTRKYFKVNMSMSDELEYTMACVCIIGNCAGRWPISSADHYVNKHIPYICILPYKDENGWGIDLPAESSDFPVFEKQYIAPQ